MKKDLPIMMFREAMLKAGGFGRYQVCMFLLLGLFSSYGSQFVYNFSLLTNEPKFECDHMGNFSACTGDDI